MFTGAFKHTTETIAFSSPALSDSATFITDNAFFVLERITGYVGTSVGNGEVSIRFVKSNRYLSDNPVPYNSLIGNVYLGAGSGMSNTNGKPLIVLPPSEQVVVTVSVPAFISGQTDFSGTLEFEGYYVNERNVRVTTLNSALVVALID